MKKIILGVHGLGNKPDKSTLKEWWHKAMQEGLESIGETSELPDFEMVYWADILHEYPLSKEITDKKNPLHLREYYTPANQKIEKKDDSLSKKISDFIVNQLNKLLLNDDYTLNYSFITDVIVSNYFKELDIYYSTTCDIDEKEKCKAADLIRKRIEDVLLEYQGCEIFLITHSMGTIIAYDALTYALPNIPVNTFVTMGSPLGLPNIISKIAFESKKINDGKVVLETPPSVKSWSNFSDIEDKIAINYNLLDDFKPNKKGIAATDYIVTNDYQVDDVCNPHKSYGYLRTKEFSEVLSTFNKLESPKLHKRILEKISNFFS